MRESNRQGRSLLYWILQLFKRDRRDVPDGLELPPVVKPVKPVQPFQRCNLAFDFRFIDEIELAVSATLDDPFAVSTPTGD